MTEREFLLLILGVQVGALLQLAVHIACDYRLSRRDRRSLDKSRRRVEKRRATCDWRDALVQSTATRDGAA